MPSVGVRQLKNELSKYLRRLKPGQVLTVTDRGRAIAEIHATPASQPSPTAALVGRFDALLSARIIRAPIEHGDPLADWPTDRELKLPRGSARTLLDADRGELP